MKLTAKLLCLVMALCMMLTFGACKKDTGALATTTQVPKDTASIYYLSGAKYGDVVYGLDQLEIGEPTEYYIFFDTDGTGELVIGGISYNTFTYADGKLTEDYTEATANYTITGDSLSLTQDGVTMVFTRGELPEWAQPEEEEEVLPEEYPEEEVVPEAAPEATEATETTG